jgi:hypothetical protein
LVSRRHHAIVSVPEGVGSIPLNLRKVGTMDDKELAELERLERAATPGPWRSWVEGRDHLAGDHVIQRSAGTDPDIYVEIRVAGACHPASVADQDFIAAARNAIPSLIEEVRRLRRARGEQSN